MRVLVDTCGWIEWLTDGILADEFAPYLGDLHNLIILPTCIQYELHKWICRERDEVLAIEVIALTQQANVIPLTESFINDNCKLFTVEVSHFLKGKAESLKG